MGLRVLQCVPATENSEELGLHQPRPPEQHRARIVVGAKEGRVCEKLANTAHDCRTLRANIVLFVIIRALHLLWLSLFCVLRVSSADLLLEASFSGKIGEAGTEAAVDGHGGGRGAAVFSPEGREAASEGWGGGREGRGCGSREVGNEG